MGVLSYRHKYIINKLNNPIYTVEFMEGWLSRPAKDMSYNHVAQLQKCMVEGYLTAVEDIMKLSEVKLENDGCVAEH